MTQAFEIHGSSSSVPSTAIEFLLDETGSMMSVWDQTIAGFNEYVVSQQNQPGDCYFTLTKFDTTGLRTPYVDAAIAEVPLLDRSSYTPRASTNLYDAIGTRIQALEARASSFKDKTVFLMVIMTDGFDNASSEFNADSVKALIKAKEAEGWTFVFLGANQDAWQVGQTFGMSQGNTMTYDAHNIKGAMGTLSAATTSMRTAYASGAASLESTYSNFFGDITKDGDVK